MEIPTWHFRRYNKPWIIQFQNFFKIWTHYRGSLRDRKRLYRKNKLKFGLSIIKNITIDIPQIFFNFVKFWPRRGGDSEGQEVTIQKTGLYSNLSNIKKITNDALDDFSIFLEFRLGGESAPIQIRIVFSFPVKFGFLDLPDYVIRRTKYDMNWIFVIFHPIVEQRGLKIKVASWGHFSPSKWYLK